MTLHTKISYWKSLTRVGGYCFLPWPANFILIAAELVGVIEEVVVG